MDDEYPNRMSDEPVEPVVPTPAEPAEPARSEGIDSPEPADLEPPLMPEPEPMPAPPQQPAFETPPPPPPPNQAPYTAPPPPAPSGVSGEKNKIIAGVLGIVLGQLGIHKFYMGYTKEGIILLLVTLLSFGLLSWATWLVGLIEGIIYLTKTDEEFDAIYVRGRKNWF